MFEAQLIFLSFFVFLKFHRISDLQFRFWSLIKFFMSHSPKINFFFKFSNIEAKFFKGRFSPIRTNLIQFGLYLEKIKPEKLYNKGLFPSDWKKKIMFTSAWNRSRKIVLEIYILVSCFYFYLFGCRSVRLWL